MTQIKDIERIVQNQYNVDRTVIYLQSTNPIYWLKPTFTLPTRFAKTQQTPHCTNIPRAMA